MMGFDDGMYYRCDRARKLAEKALEILWEKYRVLMNEAELTYPEMPEGFVITLEDVKALAEEQVFFDETFPEGVGHGPKCEAIYPQTFCPDIRCKLPLDHEGDSHLGNGIRWQHAGSVPEQEDKSC